MIIQEACNGKFEARRQLDKQRGNKSCWKRPAVLLFRPQKMLRISLSARNQRDLPEDTGSNSLVHTYAFHHGMPRDLRSPDVLKVSCESEDGQVDVVR